jgi:NADPH:quinone reductase-like Zn-dependent oxidoreductase
MRAVRYHETGGTDVLTTEDVDRPEPAAGEILVEVRAASVNHVDSLFRSGAFDPATLPMIPGSDFAGVVAEVGPEVEEYEVGDRVFGAGLGSHRPGTYAEFTAAPVDQVTHLPRGVDFDVGGSVGHVGVTAWQAMVHYGEIEPVQYSLVHGGPGGLGHVAIQLAAAAGSRVVTTTSRPDETGDHLRDLGAYDIVDYTSDSFVDDVRAATEGGPELVVDPFVDTNLETDIEVCAEDGRVVLIEGGDSTFSHPHLRMALWKDLTMQAMGMFNAPDMSAALRRLARLLEDGELDVDVARTYDLEEAAAAQDDIEAQQDIGKLALRP